jgi:hypothetical protein
MALLSNAATTEESTLPDGYATAAGGEAVRLPRSVC